MRCAGCGKVLLPWWKIMTRLRLLIEGGWTINVCGFECMQIVFEKEAKR